LEFDKHFVGSGQSRQSLNSPDIAALAGKRFVAVNESPENTSADTLNTTLIKRLASGDEPFTAMAKYKDPASFHPQCLLAFCTNSEPTFPVKDGGFRSRVSYVNMPFEWVEHPTEAGQRQIDTDVKERLAKTIQAEFFFWSRLLPPSLLHAKARCITPQPGKVKEDITTQFAASAAVDPQAPRRSAGDLGKAFVEERLVVWDKTRRPATRGDINQSFMDWCNTKGHRALPHDAFRGLLAGREDRSRAQYEKVHYDVYKRLSSPDAIGVCAKTVVTLAADVVV